MHAQEYYSTHFVRACVCMCVCVYLLPTGCSKGLYYKLNIHCICRLYANMQLIDFGSFKELQHFFVHWMPNRPFYYSTFHYLLLDKTGQLALILAKGLVSKLRHSTSWMQCLHWYVAILPDSNWSSSTKCLAPVVNEVVNQLPHALDKYYSCDNKHAVSITPTKDTV